MSTFPFPISSEASSWIVDKIRTVEEGGHVTGLVPALYFIFDAQCRTDEGRLLTLRRDPFFDICWETPEKAIAQGFVEFQLCEMRIFAPRDTLERLCGKELVLETGEVGYPIPAEETGQFLVAKATT